MTKNLTHVNELDRKKTIMIMDTNILICLFPKNHRFLHDVDPGSIKHITSTISKDMIEKDLFITDMIKSELQHKLFKKDSQILENIFDDFQIRVLKDDKKYLQIINKICNDAYLQSKHKKLVKKKIYNTIVNVENRTTDSKIKCESLYKKRTKPNVKLDNEIGDARREYDLSKKYKEV